MKSVLVKGKLSEAPEEIVYAYQYEKHVIWGATARSESVLGFDPVDKRQLIYPIHCCSLNPR